LFDHRFIGALGIACALAFGVTTPASATPILGIELIEAGYASWSTTSSANPLMAVVKNFGTFKTNVEVNTLTTNPLSIDLSSTDVSTSTAGTLTIIASATGLTTPLGLNAFFSQFSGNYNDGVISATLQTYISNSNIMLSTGTLLNSLSAAGSHFATSGSNSTTTTDPFAITEVITIKTSGKGTITFDGSISAAHEVTAAPEIDAGSGAAAIALLLGVLGLVGERRRRPEAIAA
jgi:hypothetical protein